MPRIRTLLTTFALTALSTVAGVGLATPAGATSATLPGCYGAGPYILCQITVRIDLPVDAGLTMGSIPVCVDTCVDVPVPLVLVNPDNPDGGICVTATDQSGVQKLNECLDVKVSVGSCGDNLGYSFVIVDARGMGCSALLPGVPQLTICAGQGGFYYYDAVTHIRIGDACLG